VTGGIEIALLGVLVRCCCSSDFGLIRDSLDCKGWQIVCGKVECLMGKIT
jgi:hypothetical protein